MSLFEDIKSTINDEALSSMKSIMENDAVVKILPNSAKEIAKVFFENASEEDLRLWLPQFDKITDTLGITRGLEQKKEIAETLDLSFFARSKIEYVRGNNDLALTCIQKSLKNMPDDHDLNLRYMRIMTAMGNLGATGDVLSSRFWLEGDILRRKFRENEQLFELAKKYSLEGKASAAKKLLYSIMYMKKTTGFGLFYDPKSVQLSSKSYLYTGHLLVGEDIEKAKGLFNHAKSLGHTYTRNAAGEMLKYMHYEKSENALQNKSKDFLIEHGFVK